MSKLLVPLEPGPTKFDERGLFGIAQDQRGERYVLASGTGALLGKTGVVMKLARTAGTEAAGRHTPGRRPPPPSGRFMPILYGPGSAAVQRCAMVALMTMTWARRGSRDSGM
ncbi:hypothetical protein [Massilia sp. DD77]|uniref:hypothetical protein n=1 Tax=Massilia sp. DD77 TaxID=3109349 RepID=UPI002FFFA083